MKSIPSRRKKIVGGGVGMKGIISTLAMSSEGLLAAGTFNRWVGLYDSRGRGGSVGVFGIQDNQETEESNSTYGAGITQVLWSPCGQYLCVVERGSDGIGVWDIRGSGKRLSWLKGRRARTMQRLGAEIVDRQLWAGGTDGVVRFWKNVGTREGMIDPEWEFMAHDGRIPLIPRLEELSDTDENWIRCCFFRYNASVGGSTRYMLGTTTCFRCF